MSAKSQPRYRQYPADVMLVTGSADNASHVVVATFLESFS